jgi:hypothetical protein
MASMVGSTEMDRIMRTILDLMVVMSMLTCGLAQAEAARLTTALAYIVPQLYTINIADDIPLNTEVHWIGVGDWRQQLHQAMESAQLTDTLDERINRLTISRQPKSESADGASSGTLVFSPDNSAPVSKPALSITASSRDSVTAFSKINVRRNALPGVSDMAQIMRSIRSGKPVFIVGYSGVRAEKSRVQNANAYATALKSRLENSGLPGDLLIVKLRLDYVVTTDKPHVQVWVPLLI